MKSILSNTKKTCVKKNIEKPNIAYNINEIIVETTTLR
jgi:hypothetical protein